MLELAGDDSEVQDGRAIYLSAISRDSIAADGDVMGGGLDLQ
jgi:hypothetical protein